MSDDPRDQLSAEQLLLAKAIATQLREDMTQQFYSDLGQGLWKAMKAVLGAVLLGLAVLGAKHGVLPSVEVHKP